MRTIRLDRNMEYGCRYTFMIVKSMIRMIERDCSSSVQQPLVSSSLPDRHGVTTDFWHIVHIECDWSWRLALLTPECESTRRI